VIVEYDKIQTERGQSGCPVLYMDFETNRLVPIGVHTGGKGGEEMNVGTFYGGVNGLKRIYGEEKLNNFLKGN